MAQLTQVTGMVSDPNGLHYVNGTITPTLVISGAPHFADGTPYIPPASSTLLDSTGSFLMMLADVNQLLPAGATWSFEVRSAIGTVQPGSSITEGPIAFNVSGIVITGIAQDISSQLSAAAPRLVVPGLGGGGGGGSGTVTSLTAGTGITLTPNPITVSGTISATGSGGTVTSLSAGSGITLTPNPITSTGTIATVAQGTVTSLTAGTGVTLTPNPITATGTISATGSGGTVTSISAGTGVTLTPDPITTTGTISATGTGGTVTNLTQGEGILLTPNPITGAGVVALATPVTLADGGTHFDNTDAPIGAIATAQSLPTTPISGGLVANNRFLYEAEGANTLTLINPAGTIGSDLGIIGPNTATAPISSITAPQGTGAAANFIFSAPVTVPSAPVTAPGVQLGNAGTGVTSVNGNTVSIAVANTEPIRFQSATVLMPSTVTLQWTPGAISGGGVDTVIGRSGSNIVAVGGTAETGYLRSANSIPIVTAVSIPGGPDVVVATFTVPPVARSWILRYKLATQFGALGASLTISGFITLTNAPTSPATIISNIFSLNGVITPSVVFSLSTAGRNNVETLSVASSPSGQVFIWDVCTVLNSPATAGTCAIGFTVSDATVTATCLAGGHCRLE